MLLIAKQAPGGLPDHHTGQYEQEPGLGQCGYALDLAMAVVMLLIGRLAGDAHGKVGHHRGAKIDQRMRRLRQDGERPGQHADHALRQRQTA